MLFSGNREKQGGGRNQPADAETMQLKRGLTPRSGRTKKHNSTMEEKAGQQTGRAARCRGLVDLEMEDFPEKSFGLSRLPAAQRQETGAVQGAENHKRRAPPLGQRPRPAPPPQRRLADGSKSNTE